MSAPHGELGVEPVPGVGRSVNSGIDVSCFPSNMSSIEEILLLDRSRYVTLGTNLPMSPVKLLLASIKCCKPVKF